MKKLFEIKFGDSSNNFKNKPTIVFKTIKSYKVKPMQILFKKKQISFKGPNFTIKIQGYCL